MGLNTGGIMMRIAHTQRIIINTKGGKNSKNNSPNWFEWFILIFMIIYMLVGLLLLINQ